MTSWLLGLLACCIPSSEAPPTSTEPTSSAAPAAAPTAAPAAAAALTTGEWLAAGACKEDGAVLSIEEQHTSDGRTFYALNCAFYAYQGTYEYWWPPAGGSPAKPVLTDGDAPRTVLGMPGFDPATGKLVWVEKARGPGDCGEYYVEQLQGDRFVDKEHRSRECDDGTNPDNFVDPSTWPLVTAACVGGDVAMFECDAKGGKHIAVCGTPPSRLQYRFGPAASPELVFPEDGAASAFTLEDRTFARAQATVLSFDNGEFHYEITDSMGGGGGDDAEANNFQGVYVMKADKVVATVHCEEPPRVNWDAIRAIVPAKAQ